MKTGSPTRMNPVFEAVRAGKVPPTPASFGKVLYKVDDFSFLMHAPPSNF